MVEKFKDISIGSDMSQLNAEKKMIKDRFDSYFPSYICIFCLNAHKFDIWKKFTRQGFIAHVQSHDTPELKKKFPSSLDCLKYHADKELLKRGSEHISFCYEISEIEFSIYGRCSFCELILIDEDHREEEHSNACKSERRRRQALKNIPTTNPKPSSAIPATVSVTGSALESSAAIDTDFTMRLTGLLLESFKSNNSVFYTLSSQEEKNIIAHSQEVVEKVQSIGHPNVKVVNIFKTGSMAKHTGVPGFVDVDIVVVIHDYQVKNRRMYKEIFQNAMRSDIFQFYNSGDDILLCKYRDIEIDLILTGSDPSKNDARGNEFLNCEREGAEMLSLIGSNQHVFTAIRACKYWVKRNGNVGLKSFIVEKIVFEAFKTNNNMSVFELFKSFLVFCKDIHVNTKNSIFNDFIKEEMKLDAQNLLIELSKLSLEVVKRS